MEYSEREDIELRTQAVHALQASSTSASELESGDIGDVGAGEMA